MLEFPFCSVPFSISHFLPNFHHLFTPGFRPSDRAQKTPPTTPILTFSTLNRAPKTAEIQPNFGKTDFTPVTGVPARPRPPNLKIPTKLRLKQKHCFKSFLTFVRHYFVFSGCRNWCFIVCFYTDPPNLRRTSADPRS